MHPTLFILSTFIFDVRGANVLGVFAFPSVSHHIVYHPLWRELSLRGHKITIVTPNPLNDPSLTNLTEICVKEVYEVYKNKKLKDTLSKDVNPVYKFNSRFGLLNLMVEKILGSTQLQKFISENDKFDLIFIEYFFPAMYALVEKYQAPVIRISAVGAVTIGHHIVGNPNHPVLYPDLDSNFHTKELSILQKASSVLYSIFCIIYCYYNGEVPKAHAMAKKYFGHNISYVGDFEKDFGLLYLNVNPLIYPSRPMVPSIIELGQMHLKSVVPLPKDLQKILDETPNGVIYFSLGTNVRNVDLEEHLERVITEALSELPYIVIRKWESDQLFGESSNVINRRWLPQQDLLAHPNIRAFVTHGGLQSIDEAIFKEVPLVGLPFMGDQSLNVKGISDLGIGISLDPSTLTKEEFKRSIIEVAENDKYKKRIKKVHDLLFDKPVNNIEKAIWWSEYVIRHKGVKHMRSPNTQISWHCYFLLDVFLIIFVMGVVCAYGTYKIVSFTTRCRWR